MQAQTPEVSGEKATTPADELRLVSVEQLNKIHRELDACQKAIWLAGCGQRGYGFDPAYVTGAQEQLKQIEAILAAAPAQGQQVECQECERLRAEVTRLHALVSNYRTAESLLCAELAALKAQQVEQKPVEAVHLGWDYLDDRTKVATYFVPCPGDTPPKLYTEPQPAPAQGVAEKDALLREFLDVCTGGFADDDHVRRLRLRLEALAAHKKQSGGAQ